MGILTKRGTPARCDPIGQGYSRAGRRAFDAIDRERAGCRQAEQGVQFPRRELFETRGMG